MDGSEKIYPRSGTESFRYLGLWITLTLDWTKQIQVLNKLIMDWRWKTVTACVDPAQLKATVVEYLYPQLELGLAHANITEQMCNGWMATIIHTFCTRGGMPSGHSLNRYAFCLLAGIPDLWLRTRDAS